MTTKVSAAFVSAQKAFGAALKKSTNPYYKSKYADLSSCIDAVMDSLNANGIALMQVSHESATGVIVETIFRHESGETLSSGKFYVPASKQDPQVYGSALTYARRYSLMSACGIAPEDDDGNAASLPTKQPNKHEQPTIEPWTDEQRKELFSKCTAAKMNRDEAKGFAAWALELSGMKEWTKNYASKVLDDFDELLGQFSQ